MLRVLGIKVIGDRVEGLGLRFRIQSDEIKKYIYVIYIYISKPYTLNHICIGLLTVGESWDFGLRIQGLPIKTPSQGNHKNCFRV